MPSPEENRRNWSEYDWSAGGHEWYGAFGGASGAWQMAVLPRLQAFLPAEHVLEIGPGHGLWASYLRPHAQRMTLVDVTPGCIEACRKRFGKRRMTYVVNDGRTLTEVGDGWIDLAFSMSSLVHADLSDMRSYIVELARVLKPGGIALLHHSNIGEYDFDSIPLTENGWRGRDVTHAAIAEACADVGLSCRVQELIPWGSHRLVDCISLIARPVQFVPEPEPVVFENHSFFLPAQHMLRIRARYSPDGVRGVIPDAEGAGPELAAILERDRQSVMRTEEVGVRVRSARSELKGAVRGNVREPKGVRGEKSCQ